MKQDFITFRSITPAQRAQRLLRSSGIETILQRTPAYLRERGCSYCLRVDPGNGERTLQQLEAAGISYSKYYRGGDV